MHSDRALIEERITRELHERVLPLVERATAAMTVTAGPTREQQSAFVVGSEWGPPWATTWFVLTGAVPEAWAGQRVEVIVDLGFRADPRGFQCEALVVDDAGHPVQGIHPRRTRYAVDATPGPITVVLEAAANPSFRQFAPSELGSPDTAGERPLYRFRRADVEIYRTVCDLLVQGGANAVTLETSFRAVPSIQRFVNAAFGTAMVENAATLQAAYEPLGEYRQAAHDQPAIVALPVPRPYSSYVTGSLRASGKAIDESLPDAVGAFIEWLVDEKNGWTVADRDADGHNCASNA